MEPTAMTSLDVSSDPLKRMDRKSERSPTTKKRWRTEDEQRIYSSKLLDAIRLVRRRSAAETWASPKSREVREAADRVLAVEARGRTRWSRAILSNRIRMRSHIRKRRPPSAAAVPRRKSAPVWKKTPPLQRKVRMLGRLVPGCRRLSLPSLIEETSDYIAALEMQVKAMTALSEILSAAAAVAVAGGSGGGDAARPAQS
ncbi:Transcription factor [Acorus gramineus]|uniref:Transcription factor n=1 Tax=Acorus gramineus TaxID=55184 RepID=A0AAV9BLN3_ACOGR|nr:Transcription factor [Acorus gramineus]